MSDKYYMVPEKDLRNLLSAQLELEALNQGGVYAWMYWSSSRSNYLESWKDRLCIPPHDINFNFNDIAKIEIDRKYQCITKM